MDDLDLGATIKGFSPGQKAFGRYTLKKILGRGGMGVVWLAQDGELEREVALKFLPEVVALDPEAVADLKRETRRNLNLTHANIVRIYDFVADTRTAAISMEYVDGATLSALKLGKTARVFTTAEIREWLGQLAEALSYAHTKAKVVHRDLKPANLMITREGELKITDFGIARGISDSVSRVSAQAGTSGTPLYMSPQQMLGEKPAVTDDIYSLGAMLYELLTGKPPFYSGNVVLQVQTKSPPAIAERRAELDVTGETVPAHWEQAIAACLAKDPKDRPQSVAELGQRLGLHGSPVIAPASVVVEPAPAPSLPVNPVPAPAGELPPLQRRALALLGSAALLAVIGLGLLLGWRVAAGDSDSWWISIWRKVEYSALTAWVVGSLLMIRWSYGRTLPWQPWLGMGTAMLAVGIALSEMIDRTLANNSRHVMDWSYAQNASTENILRAGPPLMGLALAAAGLVCFRRIRPVTARVVVLDLLMGLAGGLIVTLFVALDTWPDFLLAWHELSIFSYPAWFWMGPVLWFCLFQLLLVRPIPLRPDNEVPAGSCAPRSAVRGWLALAGSALLLAVIGGILIAIWLTAGSDPEGNWDARWRWVEYSFLSGWIAVSLLLVRWSLGGSFAWRPWLGLGAGLLVADIAFSEMMAPVIGTPRADDILKAAPPLLGLGLAAVGLICFRRTRSASLPRSVSPLWLGWGSGMAATLLAKIPVLPAVLQNSHIVWISFPVWVVMGSLTWLCLLQHVLVATAPASAGTPETKAARGRTLLAITGLLPLAALTASALVVLFKP